MILYKIIREKDRPCTVTEDIIRHAKLNKVDLEILQKFENKEAIKQLEKIRKLLQLIHVLHRELSRNFALFKFQKPVRYTPSDIDIIAHVDVVKDIVNILKRRRFKIAVWERYCITLTRGSEIVDIYVHPCIAGSVVYMNGEVLLRNVELRVVEDFEVPCIGKPCEVVVTSAHAVYKEGIVTLCDVLTVEEWICDEAFKIAYETKCTDSLRFLLNIVKLVKCGKIELPYKIPIGAHLMFLFRKFADDPLFRETLLFSIEKLRDPRLGSSILSHILRITY